MVAKPKDTPDPPLIQFSCLMIRVDGIYEVHCYAVMGIRHRMGLKGAPLFRSAQIFDLLDMYHICGAARWEISPASAPAKM
jgi:hypothetical protein